MKWIGQHIWDFVSRFRNDVYLEDLTEVEQEFTIQVAADGKLTKSTAPSERSRIKVRNDEGSTIPAGAPLYSRGEVGGSDIIRVGICLSSDPTKMPCIGVAEFEMNTTDTKDSFAVTQGVYNTNISGFTGLSEGDILYVNGGTAPHLTPIKPTNGDLIQNVGVVLKTNGTTCQGLLVAAIGRTNDVPWPLYIDRANQRVGIGTSSPQKKLDIASGDIRLDNSKSIFFATTDANIGRVSITGDEGSDFIRLKVDNNNSHVLHLNTTGVGIGTTSPSEKLEVAGKAIIRRTGTATAHSDTDLLVTDATASSSTAAIQILGGSAGYSNLQFSDTDSYSQGGILYNHSTDAMTIKTGASSAITIDSSQNVGIGTTSISEKLDIAGNIKASGTLIAKQYQAFQCNFINDISTTKYYLPLETVAAQTVRYQDEACMLAHADGRLASVTLKVENLNGASGNITFGIEVLQSTGTGYSGTWTVVETETMAVASTHNHDVFHFHFSTAKHFDSTHMFAISIQSDNAALGGEGGNDERWFVTPVIEWDYNTYLGTNGTSTRYDTTP